MASAINKVNYFNKATASPSDDAPRVNCQTIEYTSVNPHNPSQTLRIIALSDTYGQHSVLGQLPDCDILIFAGNMLSESKNMSDTEAKDILLSFNVWLGQQTAKHKIIIGGNHDQKLEDLQSRIFMAGIQQMFSNATYLCNTSVTIEGLNIVGIPFSVKDTGNQGFQSREATKQTEDFLNFMIERNTKVDILITHGPCENIGTMLKPKLVHISGRAKNNYGIGRIMHVPLEIEETSNRNRNAKRPVRKDLFCYTIVACTTSVDGEPINPPIMFDSDRAGASRPKAAGGKGTKNGKCIIL